LRIKKSDIFTDRGHSQAYNPQVLSRVNYLLT
jgi:hypothetical protein